MTTSDTIEPLRFRASRPTVPARRRGLRWAIALVIVLVLHFWAGVWVIRATRVSGPDQKDANVPVQVALLKPQAVTDVSSGGTPAAGAVQSAPSNTSPAPARSDALQASLGAPAGAPPGALPGAAASAKHASATPSKRAESASDHHARQQKAARPSRAPSEDRPQDAHAIEHASERANGPSLEHASEPVAETAQNATASGSDAASASVPAAAASDTTLAQAASGSATTPVAASASSASTAAVTSTASGTANAQAGSPDTEAVASVGPGVRARAANAAKGERFSLPPSSDLRYDSFYNGVQNPSGTIHWTTDGSTYEMVVSIPLPFVGTYSYTSEGRIDAFGLAPLRYTEHRGRRGTDVTTFDRDADAGKPHASFTKTTANVDLPDGAQDRFSMFMQLSSLVRGNPTRYTAGVTREFFVLDNDSGEIWPIETVGDETVHTNMGFVPARHFTRLPRRDGDRRKVDVWLAPALGWLPIRFLQTEPDGTQIELRFAGSTQHDGSADMPPLDNPSPATHEDVKP